RRRAVLMLDPTQQTVRISQPYDAVAMTLFVTAFLIGIFYCLDALHAERRDRSILFWKSLPVSDFTTVVAKASVPLVILPFITFVGIVIAQLIMLLQTTIILLPSGLAGSTWTRFNIFEQTIILFYGLVTTALWHAPIYSWL